MRNKNGIFSAFAPRVSLFENQLTEMFYPDSLKNQETLTLQSVRFTIESGSFDRKFPCVIISDFYYIISE